MRNLSKLILATSFSLLMSGTASAQLIVNGNGAAHDCYISAKSNNQGSKSAIQTCRTALTQVGLSRKHQAATHVNLGILLMRKGDNEDSLKNYEAALKIKPSLSEIYINRAAAHIRLQNYDSAISDVTQAIDLGTTLMPEALFNRAIAYDRLANYKSAYKDLKQALVLRPDWEPAEKLLSNYSVSTRSQTN